MRIRRYDSLFSLTKSASERIDNCRTPFSVLSAVVGEVGELAEEVAISEGYSYKKEGADGVIGEAMDVIAAVLDLVLIIRPDITEEELCQVLAPKLEKWISKTSEHGKFKGLE